MSDGLGEYPDVIRATIACWLRDQHVGPPYDDDADSLLAALAERRCTVIHESQIPAPARSVPPPFDPDPELIDHLEGNERTIRRYRKRAERMRDAGLENARRIVASIPPLTDAQCDSAALDYAQTRLDEIWALHAPYHCPAGDVVCRECSEPDDWDETDGPYLHPTVHLVAWPCRTVSEAGPVS